MKIERFIYSTDENPNYIYNWPLVSKITKKIFNCNVSLAFITNRCENDRLVNRMKEFGEVYTFKTIDVIPVGNQAKVSRMYLASTYGSEICVLNDIDLFPLQKDFLENLLYDVPNDCLAAIGGNAFKKHIGFGKFPMVYTSASGNTFKEIINPDDLKYEDLLKKWMDMKIFDGQEAINSPHNIFSDESLLRALISFWKNKNKIIKLDRNDFIGMRAQKRIDRVNWKIDSSILNNNYIDAHVPRPFNIDLLFPILEYFNISKEEIIL